MTDFETHPRGTAELLRLLRMSLAHVKLDARDMELNGLLATIAHLEADIAEREKTV